MKKIMIARTEDEKRKERHAEREARGERKKKEQKR
jgi:hypothetical protein